MLPKQFKPKHEYDLIRIGGNNDGGYIVERNSIKINRNESNKRQFWGNKWIQAKFIIFKTSRRHVSILVRLDYLDLQIWIYSKVKYK